MERGLVCEPARNMPRLDPQRFLALDIGDRRIGVAVGSRHSGLAQPLETLDRAQGGGDAAVFSRLRELVREHEAGTVVVGDPINMDGTAGPRAEISRAFAATLAKALRQVRVVLHDERLSSFAADEQMRREALAPKRRRARRDAYAAVAILRDYLQTYCAEE